MQRTFNEHQPHTFPAIRSPLWCITLSAIFTVLNPGMAPDAARAAAPIPPPFAQGVTPIGPAPPWRARVPEEGVMRPTGLGLVALSDWPEEPPAPAELSLEQLATAIDAVCLRLKSGASTRFATVLMKWADHYEVDATLLAAVMAQRSICDPTPSEGEGVGLMRLPRLMHRRAMHDGAYHYSVLDAEGSAWIPKTRVFPEGISPWAIRRSEGSIAYAALQLAVWREQCPHIDGPFGSAPHRHFVSHLWWGDRVKGTDREARVLTMRRRIIESITGDRPKATGLWNDIVLHSPLEGSWRRLSSIPGDPRDDGRRRHQGVDFVSERGEMVRAVADGEVVFAGVDLKGKPSACVSSRASMSFSRRKMGAGGRFVMLRHGDTLRSAYMHLDRYFVVRGDTVVAGQPIGTVGRSGMRASPAHLHFELREGRRDHIDPTDFMGAMAIHTSRAWKGRRMAALWARSAERKKKRRRERLRLRRQRKGGQ